MLQVTNTLSGKKELFEPITPGQVRMYVCGPTVYDHPHIGHGRVYVLFDAVSRYLRYKGFKVTYVRNLTDIDDKIIKKSNEEKIPFNEVSERYTASYIEDMNRLGLALPEVQPKASETVVEMIQMIEKMISDKKAYVSDHDVYFSIAASPDYGKLSKRDLEQLKTVARVEPGERKRDPLDFALWKGAKLGEPSWPSPWGAGRPGWHIECSAMAKKFLGETIDIHAGGHDLIFPHHENEIAQSEAANGKPFVKYWLHNGFLNLHKEKMSKSLGNIVTLKGLFERFHPEALKFYLLSSHYRSPIEFSDEGVEEAARGLDRIYRVLLTIPKGEGSLVNETIKKRFEEAMDDDFNTAKAIAVIFDAVKEANKLQQKPETLPQATALRETIVHLAGVLGLLTDDPAHYFQSLPGMKGVDNVKIESLIAERLEARRKKNFTRADEIREELKSLKVVVEDHPEGTTWRLG